MKGNFKISKLAWILAMCFIVVASLSSCKKAQYPLVSLNTTLNITSYIEANPAQFSLFDQILQRTGYDGFLGAYGAYTVFAPNNDAVTLYLKSKNAASVNDINIDTLKDLVKYHVIVNDTISTTYFIDGKLRTPTFLGQYLTTSVVNVDGVSSYSINKQALIVRSNITLGNGVLHVIDHVLKPATLTLAQTLDANPKYKIFTAALKLTKFYDTINVAALTNPNKLRNYFTVFAQTDSLYKTLNINSLADLQALYATTTNPTSPQDGFYQYIAYHIVPENDYLTDILSKPSHPTLSPGQDVITDVLQVQNIQLNYDNINGVQYPGVSIDRNNSNIPTTNGVLHAVVNGDLYIKVFPPTRVDWDVADQPEFRKQTAVFRRAGQSSTALTSPMTNITFSGVGTAQYVCNSTTSGTYYWWNDYLNLANWRVTSGIPDVTFITPTIIKGKYKVWFSYQRGSNMAGVQFYFDGAPLQNVLPNTNTLYGVPTDSGPVMESKGFKRYTAAPYSATTNNIYNTDLEFLCGVVTVPTTDHHIFKLVCVGGPASSNPLQIDIIQFIPYDANQEVPRYFYRDGTVGN